MTHTSPVKFIFYFNCWILSNSRYIKIPSCFEKYSASSGGWMIQWHFFTRPENLIQYKSTYLTPFARTMYVLPGRAAGKSSHWKNCSGNINSDANGHSDSHYLVRSFHLAHVLLIHLPPHSRKDQAYWAMQLRLEQKLPSKDAPSEKNTRERRPSLTAWLAIEGTITSSLQRRHGLCLGEEDRTWWFSPMHHWWKSNQNLSQICSFRTTDSKTKGKIRCARAPWVHINKVLPSVYRRRLSQVEQFHVMRSVLRCTL